MLAEGLRKLCRHRRRGFAQCHTVLIQLSLHWTDTMLVLNNERLCKKAVLFCSSTDSTVTCLRSLFEWDLASCLSRNHAESNNFNSDVACKVESLQQVDCFHNHDCSEWSRCCWCRSKRPLMLRSLGTEISCPCVQLV